MPSEKMEPGSGLVLKKFAKMDVDLPQANSQVELVQPPTGGYPRSSLYERTMSSVSASEWIQVAILCFVNLINYMDRFTVAGVLRDVQSYYDIGDDKGGLLQTAFVFSYMIFAPIFGYMGDRYSRRWIMGAGVCLWSLTTLLGSFMTNYWWFLVFRALVGIGEASYSTIAPTLISDLFVGQTRSKMLALFYFAIPVGSGLGYIVGSETAKALGSWHYGLRVTPVLGAVAVLLILFVLEEPERGQSERTTDRHDINHLQTNSWLNDVTDILKNRSFMLSTAGFTCVAFVAGALSWWGPKFILMGIRLQDNQVAAGATGSDPVEDSVSFNFGLVAMLAGVVGVPCGSFAAQWLRPHWGASIDPYICAVGMLVSTPLVYASCYLAQVGNSALCFTVVFWAETFLNLTWSLVGDILLYVVMPNRRSTAEGFQLLVSHALGDAGSPYLIGLLSETFQRMLAESTNDSKARQEFTALQYALFTTCFVEVLGGFFFLMNALYIQHDKQKVTNALSGSPTDLLDEDAAIVATSSPSITNGGQIQRH